MASIVLICGISINAHSSKCSSLFDIDFPNKIQNLNLNLSKIQSGLDPYLKTKIGDRLEYSPQIGIAETVTVSAIYTGSFAIIDRGGAKPLKERYKLVNILDLRNENGTYPTIDVHEKIGATIPSISEYRSARAGLIPKMNHVSRYEQLWNVDGNQKELAGFQSYDSHFWNALGQRSVEQYLKDRKIKNLGTHVLDLFGSALFTNDISYIDSLSGARLELKYTPQNFPPGKWAEIDGNFLSSQAWRKLKLNMQTRNIPSYDLIIFRPVGAEVLFNPSQPNSINLSHLYLHRMFTNAYNLLSSNDGVILVDFSHPIMNVDSRVGKDFYDMLDYHKIKYEIVKNSHSSGDSGYLPVLKITKTKQSSKNI